MTNQGTEVGKKARSIEDIEKKAKEILGAYSDDGAGLDRADVNDIVAKLITVLRSTGRTKLDHDDTVKILDRLVVRSNPKSPATLELWRGFQHVAEKLTNKGFIHCPHVRVPKRSRRYLIYDSDDYILKNVPLIQVLHDDLLSLRAFQSERYPPKLMINIGRRERVSRLREREIEYLCTFVASAAIFGKILFDDFHRYLLQIRCGDVYLRTCHINLAYPDTNALRRFFLPYPASVYFMRCLMFYRNNATRLGMKPLDHPANYIFNETLLEKFATIFREWNAKRLKTLGHDCGDGLTTFEFRAAVKKASFGELAGAVEYPPFLVAIQSNAEGIVSHSYGNCHLPYFADISAERHDYEEKWKNLHFKSSRSSGKVWELTAGIMPSVIKVIGRARRKLNKPGMYTKEKRQEVLDEIYHLFTSSDMDEFSDDYHNVQLYLLWFEHMVWKSKKAFSSMNTYASQVPRLLYYVSEAGALDSLPLGMLVEYISQTMYLYNSTGIKKALKSFCNYLHGLGLKKFGDIKWNSKTLAKKNTPTMKAFIPLEDLQAALDKADEYFTRYARRLTTKNRKKKIEVAEHKAKIYRLFIVLGYFTGMRISEILRLKLGDIRGDQYLLIRKSKTKSGVRNIYFESLMPNTIYQELMAYVRQCKSEGRKDNDTLFTQDSGNEWAYNHVSADVARLFAELGYRNFRFHHLRHCFANIFMFRWLHAFYAEKVPGKAPIFRHELFEDKKKAQFKQLLFGFGADADSGQHDVNFAIYALSKIMGHAGPVVTLKEYIHCADILFYLWSRESDNWKIKLKPWQAKDFMQYSHDKIVSYYQAMLRDEIDGKKIYEHQKDFMWDIPWVPKDKMIIIDDY